jgi:L-ribulose-5-phosphate 3-epimerase
MRARQPARALSPRIRTAVSTYSYWHFRTPKYPIEKVIEDAARLGFDGVEILHRQMDDETPAYVNKLKQAAFRNGLDLPMLSIHQDFISPKKEERDEAVARRSAASTWRRASAFRASG